MVPTQGTRGFQDMYTLGDVHMHVDNYTSHALYILLVGRSIKGTYHVILGP